MPASGATPTTTYTTFAPVRLSHVPDAVSEQNHLSAVANGDFGISESVKMDPHVPPETVAACYEADMPAGSHQRAARIRRMQASKSAAAATK